ncbi:hypothetical protein FQZ97_1220840 [compost metagenome]
MVRVIPFQVETLPAIFKEGIETHVIVLFSGLDLFHFLHAQRFIADDLPVLLQRLQFRELLDG